MVGQRSAGAGASAGAWLIDHDDLPGWATDNHFIVSGYRRPGGWTEDQRAKLRALSKATNGHADVANDDAVPDMTAYEHSTFWRCWTSMWAYWHNESVNIHTHFWGALLAFVLLVLHVQHLLLPTWSPALPTVLQRIAHAKIFYPSSLSFGTGAVVEKASSSTTGWLSLSHVPTESSHPPDVRDVAGFAAFFLGATLCFSFSATFHCCGCHSQRISASFNKLDYIGIVVMIVGSFLPALHYGFYCHPQLQMLYATMIVGLGGLAMYAVIDPQYATPQYRPVRTSLFIGLGLSAVFPVVHVCVMYGYETVSRIMGLSFVIASGAMYIVGACLYMARIPERFAPGRFDLIGASHQIFHVFILLAAFLHYVSLRRAYAFVHSVEHMSSTITGRGDGGLAAVSWGRAQVCQLLEAHRSA